MKTKNACFWIFLLLSGSAYAQMSQKGTVQIFNSNKSPLPGVQLTATDAPATDTDASGISSSTSANRNREWLSLLRMYIRKDMNW